MASGLLVLSLIFGSLTGNIFFLMALALYLLGTCMLLLPMSRRLSFTPGMLLGQPWLAGG
ncbi:MAG: hypothetical protein AAFN63_18420 [Pseudomonadota bacterium]